MANKKKKEWKDLKETEKRGAIIIMGVIGLFIVGALMSGISSIGKTSDNTQTTSNSEVAKTPEESLKASVNDAVGKDGVRAIDVVKQVDGGYGVFVQYNANDNLSTDMIKKGIEKTMSDVYIALYHESDQDVQQASVAAYFPMADSYGNTSDEAVYKSVLKKSEADKINFSANKATLELDIIPGVWDTTLLNVAFR